MRTLRPVIDGWSYLSGPEYILFSLPLFMYYIYLRTFCISIKVNVPVGGFLLSLFQEIDRKESLIIDPLQQ